LEQQHVEKICHELKEEIFTHSKLSRGGLSKAGKFIKKQNKLLHKKGNKTTENAKKTASQDTFNRPNDLRD